MKEDSRIGPWLDARAESNNTRRLYVGAWNCWREFCERHGKDVSRLVDGYRAARHKDRGAEDAFLEEWQDLVRAFHSWLKQRGLTPFTIKDFLVALRSFCRYWKIPLDVELPRHPCVIWHNRDLKADEVRLILNNATPRDRAVFLFIVESGMRSDNATRLKYWQIKEDFEADRVPMKVLLPSAPLKDHVGDRWTFIGEDGFKELKNYLCRRLPLDPEDYVFCSEKEGRVVGEQFTPASLSVKFNRLVQKLGIDKSRGKRDQGQKRMAPKMKQVRLHGLRKYFRNNVKVDSAFVNFWMGHSLGTDAHYISRDPEQHRSLYKEGYQHLRLYESDPTSIVNLVAQLHQKDEEIAAMKKEIAELQNKITFVVEVAEKFKRIDARMNDFPFDEKDLQTNKRLAKRLNEERKKKDLALLKANSLRQRSRH